VTKIAIIGDNFMLPEMFREKLLAAVDRPLDIRTSCNNWPGNPLVHGHAGEGVDGLKEYFGNPDEVVEFVQDAQILITHLAPITNDALSRLPDLKMIAVSRGGPVNINLKACHEQDVLVVNTPGRNASAVAEFTLGLILTETRKIRVAHEDLRRGKWSDKYYRADTTGRELCEMTVGIVGYGAIGRLVAGLLKSFGCRIEVSDPYASLSQEDEASGVQIVSLDELLAISDIVTLHPKVSAETIGMMSAEAFGKMKKGAFLINTTRGSLCDDDALLRALQDGTLEGAAIDTFTVEPIPANHPLLAQPNVTLTPHIAGGSVRTVAHAAEQIAEEIRRYLAGEAPVNPQ